MIDGVLLIAFGGPTAPSEIRPFLANVTRGTRIPAVRIEEVARHYERMPGGRSPLNDLTFAQARALSAALEAAGLTLPVFVGMRHWHPYLHETLATMKAAGVRRVLGVILSVLRTEASWDRYVADVVAARARTRGAPEVVFGPPWSAHPRFLDAVTDRCRDALNAVPADHRASASLVFTAHSVPVAMAEGSPYVAELEALARGVAARLGHKRWSLAYQSRSGDPREPWLEPDIVDLLRELAARGREHVVVAPIGFVVDHVEVLYDLDTEARAAAEGLGLTLHRARTVNDHPDFVAALTDVVRTAISGAEAPSSAGRPARGVDAVAPVSTARPPKARAPGGSGPAPTRPGRRRRKR